MIGPGRFRRLEELAELFIAKPARADLLDKVGLAAFAAAARTTLGAGSTASALRTAQASDNPGRCVGDGCYRRFRCCRKP
jgi:hypothetical protein